MSDPTCPKCGSPIPGEAGFGMVMCEKCGELVLLGESGPEIAPDIAPVSQVYTPEPSQEYSAPEPLQDFSSEAFPQGNPQDVQFDNIEASQEPLQNAIQDAPVEPLPDPGTNAERFQDVVEFGNNDQPSTAFGALVYDIKIQGVDTLEMREALHDCLSDKRLELNPKEILTQITDGEVMINQINPVKASVILTRLKHLPLKVLWSSQQLIKQNKIILVWCFVAFQLIASRGFSIDDLTHDEVNLKKEAVRIEMMQNDIHDLIEKKNKNRDPEVRDKLLAEIVKKNQDLTELYKSFREDKQHILHDHPEQGDTTERKYRHVKYKSLTDLENESGVDGRLDQIKVKVEESYGQPVSRSSPSSPRNQP